MADLLKVRWSYVLENLIKAHFYSTVIYFTIIFVTGIFEDQETYSFGANILAVPFSLIWGAMLTPFSFLFAAPSLFLGLFASVSLMKRSVTSYVVWLLVALVIGSFYLPFLTLSILWMCIPISLLNGFFMCRAARRYYAMEEAK